MTFFITSTGHVEPAITPVRSVDRSSSSASGRASMAMNIAGTPYRLVAPVAATARSAETGSKLRAGMTASEPWETVAITPITMPKQWKNGTGITTVSSSV